jgi:hypothetical protein
MIAFDSQGGEAQGVSSEIEEDAAGIAKLATAFSSNPMLKMYRTKSPASPWDGRVGKPSIRWGCRPV